MGGGGFLRLPCSHPPKDEVYLAQDRELGKKLITPSFI